MKPSSIAGRSVLRGPLQFCLIALLAGAVSADGAAGQEAARAGAPSFVGSYLFAPERSDDVEEAIDAGVADMNFLARPIARRRLRGTTRPYQTISIQRPEGEIVTLYDGRAPIRAPDDGSPVSWQREDGEVLRLSVMEQDGALVQSFVAEDGSRENRYRLSDDGRTLTLTVTIRSGRLPAPIVYDLQYDRP